MSNQFTNRDIQRATFVESLHNSLNKQTAKAISEHKKYAKIAESYMNDGLDESECVELLVIDGINREAAESYVAMVKESNLDQDIHSGIEYSFQFDDNGLLMSSYDIGKTIIASSEDEAWTKAEEVLNTLKHEGCEVISIHKEG